MRKYLKYGLYARESALDYLGSSPVSLYLQKESLQVSGTYKYQPQCLTEVNVKLSGSSSTGRSNATKYQNVMKDITGTIPLHPG